MLDGQRLQPGRYKLVPRTLVFLVDDDRILLLRVADSRGAWRGKLNGLGGHIERGEHPAESARREIQEETGLRARELRLCGVVTIDTDERVGIGLYVFVGTADSSRPLQSSSEGQPSWFKKRQLEQLDLVEDLPVLVPRALAAYQGDQPFVGLYSFDGKGRLKIDLMP